MQAARRRVGRSLRPEWAGRCAASGRMGPAAGVKSMGLARFSASSASGKQTSLERTATGGTSLYCERREKQPVLPGGSPVGPLAGIREPSFDVVLDDHRSHAYNLNDRPGAHKRRTISLDDPLDFVDAGQTSLWDIRQFLYPERYRLAGGIVLLAGSTSISLVFPRVIGTVMDSCLSGETAPAGEVYSPTSAALVLFGLSVVQAIFVASRSQVLNRSGEAVATRLRQQTFKSLVFADCAFLDGMATGEMLSRLSSDTDAIRKLVTTHALSGLRSALMVCGCAGMMLHISPALCAVSFATFPTAMMLTRHTGRIIKNRQAVVQSALAQASADAHTALLNIRTLRLFSGERRAAEVYDTRTEAVRSHAVAVGTYAAVMEAGMGLALSSSLLIVLAVGGQQVLDGGLSYGDLSSFFMYTLSLGFSVGGLSTVYAEVQRASGASERLLSLLRRPSPRSGGLRLPALAPGMTGREVRFEKVEFAYPSRPTEMVLREFSLIIPAGQRVALIGNSGSGKSTIISLLAGLYSPLAGHITIDGINVSELDGDHLRGECICIVPQDPVLLAGSLRENIALGRPGASDEELTRAAISAGCDFVSEPRSLSRTVGEQGFQMSGGQRQRIAIARMLIRDSPVVVLDEFTSALDQETEESLLQSLAPTLLRKTVLIITHRTSSLALADRVVQLGQDGCIIKDELLR